MPYSTTADYLRPRDDPNDRSALLRRGDLPPGGSAADTACVDAMPNSAIALVRKLHDAGVRIGIYSSGRDCEQVLASVGDIVTVCVDGSRRPGPSGDADSTYLQDVATQLACHPSGALSLPAQKRG